MIVYFTGTGNSRWAAQYLACALGQETLDSLDSVRDGRRETYTSSDPWIFVCPTYAWRLPRVFERFLLSSGFQGCRKAYFVLTCGGSMGDAPAHLKGVCQKLGLEFMGAAALVMPENYVAMFQVPGPEEAEKIRQQALPALEALKEDIQAGRRLRPAQPGLKGRLQTWVVNPLFYLLCVRAKPFLATEDCVGCGVCVQKCPMNNVRLKNGRPVWGDSCTHCMACISYCPVEAVEYGAASRGKPRYRCPEYRAKG